MLDDEAIGSLIGFAHSEKIGDAGIENIFNT